MVSSQLEFSASQLGLELPDECNYRQEFPLGDTILSFRLAQHVATISNYPLLPGVVNLGQNGSNADRTGICVQDKGEVKVRVS